MPYMLCLFMLLFYNPVTFIIIDINIFDNFRIIGQVRSSFHLSVLESVYIKTQNPVLCKQKDFIFSLGIFK